MGKNKRKHPEIDEVLGRPWCYYCERDFDDLKILINHQKAKHYKCDRCGRRLNTAGGLSVHMTQVHKETLTEIENALPNRSGLEVEIFGMEGIPDEITQSHRQRVLQQFAQSEADRRAATGNGPADGNAQKKPKFEAPSDLKKRLAEHKAKKAAEEAAAGGSGSSTPRPVGDSVQSPPPGAQTYSQQHGPGPLGLQPNNAQYSPYQPQPLYQQQPPLHSQHQPPFQQQPPPQFPQQPGYGPPGPPVMQPNYPTHQTYGPPPPQYQSSVGPGYPPPQYQNGPPQFQNSPPQFQPGPSPFQGGPPQFQPVPTHPYGAGSPPPFQQSTFQPPRHNTPPQHNGMPQRPPSLPMAPSLPQRPAFGAPPVNAQEMQQMHHGHFKGPNPQDRPFSPQQQPSPVGFASANPKINTQPQPALLSANASSLDELVAGAAKDADSKPAEQKPIEQQEEKIKEKAKKEKDKNMRLIYADNEISPEEKMAQMPRYAFVHMG